MNRRVLRRSTDKQIHDDRQVEATLPRLDIGVVRHPNRIVVCRCRSVPNGSVSNAVARQRTKSGLRISHPT